MTRRRRWIGWHAGPPELGVAVIAGLGCALPLLLGLLSGHPGFLWASAGAFQASQVSPLHRYGMLRLLMLTLLGACSAGLGFWATGHAWASVLLFGAFGLLLAWLQRFGKEAGKLGMNLAICLCLGQGHTEVGGLHNADAVAALFILGGLWVALLAFGLRGLHGLRTWPHMPRLMAVLRVLRRQAKLLPERRWRLHALGCALALGSAGLIVELADLPRGHWLTLALLGTLQLRARSNLARALQLCMVSLASAVLLLGLGYSLQSPAAMVAITLPVIVLGRALQAHRYGLYVLQVIVSFMLLSECLAQDWQDPQQRLLNSLVGVVLAMLVAMLIHALARRFGQAKQEK